MNAVTFWSRVDKSGGPDACWPWQRARKENGYGAAWFEGRLWRANRLAYHLTHQADITGSMILHSCDNPPCCNPRHLRKGTRSDNANDSISRGRWNRPLGEKAFKAKLTADQVMEIRRLYASGTRQVDLSRQFGITAQAIASITSRKHWKHV